MSLMALETKWRKALICVLRELTEQQLSKLLFSLDKIPQGVKAGKSREDIAHLIIEYYGTEGSISVIHREMKQLPRNDEPVQKELRPVVEKLKILQQKNKEKKNKPAAGSVATKPKPAAGVRPAAGSSGPSATKPKAAAGQLKVGPPDAKKSAVLQRLTQSSDRKRKEDPVGVVKPKEKKEKPDPKPAEPTQTSKVDPFRVVKPKEKKEKPDPKPAEPTQTSKPPAAPVRTVTVKILGVKSSNKTNTHLQVELCGQRQALFVTTSLLAKALGFKPDEDFTQMFSPEVPLAAEAKIQGNKIIDIKKM